MEQIMEFIKPELLVLIPVLIGLGFAFKKAERVKDNNIPLFLIACGGGLALLYGVASTIFSGYQDVLMTLFTALTQGVLCALMAVGTHQTVLQKVKQSNE